MTIRIHARCDKCKRETGLRMYDDGTIFCLMCGHKYENIIHGEALAAAVTDALLSDRAKKDSL